MIRCSKCGETNPDRARFCLACGGPLGSKTPGPEGARRFVTVVFSDLVDSTALGEGLDSESLREVFNRYFEAMRTVLEHHGGIVEKYIGDAIMAVFGLPRAHEDDALRATRAAAEMISALAALNVELERTWGVKLATRTGVDTGEIVVGDLLAGQRLATGDVVNVAARLEQAAPSNGVLLGEATYHLVEDAVTVDATGPLSLKGKAAGVAAFRLVAMRPSPTGITHHSDAPLIGRRDEIGRLMKTFKRAESERRCYFVTVLGDAGVGKSRLLAELADRLMGRAEILPGRCLPYGERVTFWPIAEVVKSAAGISDDSSSEAARKALGTLLAGARDASAVDDRVASAIGLNADPYPVREIFWAVRKLLERVAGRRPLVVIFEDVHWGEATFLDLIEHCADLMTDVPTLLICSARPDLLEIRPDWGTNRDYAECVSLEPLSASDSDVLIETLLGASALSAEARSRIRKAAGGNPLFVKQMISMWIDDGVIRRDNGRWLVTADLSRESVPPAISALLAARLDKLDDDERAVIASAALIGQEFLRDALLELCEQQSPQAVDRALEALMAKGLIRHDPSILASEQAFAFSHGLIRDAAYEGMLKRVRAELHERFVVWLEAAGVERISDFREIAGYHLERAYRLRVELAAVDEHARKLAARAGTLLAQSGQKAYERSDIPAAVNLLRRAISLLPPNASGRLELLCTLADALREHGELVDAQAILVEARGRASERGDRRLEAYVSLAALRLQFFVGSSGWAHRARDEFNRVIEVFEEANDDRGLAGALCLLSDIHWSAGRASDAEATALSALHHANLVGAVDSTAHVFARLPTAAALGPTPVAEALRRCDAIRRRCGDNLASRSWVQFARGYLLAMTGQFDEAMGLAEAAMAQLGELGMELEKAAVAGQGASYIEVLAGRLDAAEERLRESLAALEQLGEKSYLSTNAGMLAGVLCAQRHYPEAEALSHKCADAADESDVSSQVLWRSALSKVRAQQGHVEEGERLGREALKLIDATDFTNDRANVRLDLAEVLRVAKSSTAIVMARDALSLYEQKGNHVAAAKARSMASELTLTALHRPTDDTD